MSEQGPGPASEDADPVLVALDELLAAARMNIIEWVAVMGRVEEIRALRRQGLRYGDMTPGGGSAPIVEVVARNQERLSVAAAQFRRIVAQALLDEGWSHADVARTFGVSRQRVANLLRNSANDGNSDATAVDGIEAG